MTELTDERLNEIEQRANTATPGPWTYEEFRFHGMLEGFTVRTPCGDLIYWEPNVPDGAGEPVMNEEEADFIAAARSDIPLLVAEVRRLHAELSETQTVADHWRCIAEGKDSRWLWVAAMQWLPSDLWCELNLASTQSAWFMRLRDAWNALAEQRRKEQAREHSARRTG